MDRDGFGLFSFLPTLFPAAVPDSETAAYLADDPGRDAFCSSHYRCLLADHAKLSSDRNVGELDGFCRSDGRGGNLVELFPVKPPERPTFAPERPWRAIRLHLWPLKFPPHKVFQGNSARAMNLQMFMPAGSSESFSFWL